MKRLGRVAAAALRTRQHHQSGKHHADSRADFADVPLRMPTTHAAGPLGRRGAGSRGLLHHLVRGALRCHGAVWVVSSRRPRTVRVYAERKLRSGHRQGLSRRKHPARRWRGKGLPGVVQHASRMPADGNVGQPLQRARVGRVSCRLALRVSRAPRRALQRRAGQLRRGVLQHSAGDEHCGKCMPAIPRGSPCVDVAFQPAASRCAVTDRCVTVAAGQQQCHEPLANGVACTPTDRAPGRGGVCWPGDGGSFCLADELVPTNKAALEAACDAFAWHPCRDAMASCRDQRCQLVPSDGLPESPLRRQRVCVLRGRNELRLRVLRASDARAVRGSHRCRWRMWRRHQHRRMRTRPLLWRRRHLHPDSARWRGLQSAIAVPSVLRLHHASHRALEALSANVSETATPVEFTVQGDGAVSHAVAVSQSS